MVKRMIFIALLGCLLISLFGCNTVSGLGRDISGASQTVEGWISKP